MEKRKSEVTRQSRYLTAGYDRNIGQGGLSGVPEDLGRATINFKRSFESCRQVP